MTHWSFSAACWIGSGLALIVVALNEAVGHHSSTLNIALSGLFFLSVGSLIGWHDQKRARRLKGARTYR